MKSLTVSVSSEQPILYVGELRVMQFYRRDLSDSWTSVEKIMDFCEATIRLTIENMIMHQVIISNPGTRLTKFLHFFTQTEYADFLSVDETKIQGKDLGYLEKRIIKELLTRPAYPASACIASLFTQFLGKDTFTDPGREIMNLIVRGTPLEFWSYREKKILWLFSEMHVDIDEEHEIHMVNELNSIVKPIIVERNRNLEFRRFSERISGEIDEQIHRRHRTSD